LKPWIGSYLADLRLFRVLAHLMAHLADVERSMSTSRSVPAYLAIPPTAPLMAAAGEKHEYEIVGSSAAVRRLRLQIRRIGPHFRTVLIQGEAGTGRELVARALHEMSQGAGGPFVVCHATDIANAAADEERMEAIGRLMKIAQRGTLFLAGVGEMPLEVQGPMLNALKRYELAQVRVNASQRADLRMIASTVEDLKILVSTGRFRQELYQRLATVDIALPPLREHMEDLPELVRHFLHRSTSLYGKSIHRISESAMERMQRYRWPGNVRELESVLRNGVVQSEGRVLESCHLPMFAEEIAPERPAMGASESARLQDVVERHVLRVLKDCRGNKLRAAEVLGISRSTLYRMLDAGAPLSTVD
jgi:DNA-binding NtrC family response regulator